MRGRLWLDFHVAEGATRLTIREQKPPLAVVRAFQQGGTAMAHLQNVSGGVLGGDHLDTRIEVGEGSRAQLTTTGATRLYRSRAGSAESLRTVAAVVKDGALLEWLPDPLIPFAGSRSRVESTIDLGDDAGLFWWETLAPGRVAHEELFAYDLLDTSLQLRSNGKPMATENYRIEPSARNLSSLVRMGPYRYLTTFYICRVGHPSAALADLEAELRALLMARSREYGEYWGASTLSEHGVVVKGLTNSAVRLNETLFDIWRIGKCALYGEAAVMPRKVY